MELFLLVIAGVVLAAVYYAVTAVTAWWEGFRNRHTPLLRAALFIAVAIALLAVVIPESATLGPVVDVAIGAGLALLLLTALIVAVAAWRGRRQRQTKVKAVSHSKLPLVERISTGRNRHYNASRPPPLVERSEPRRNTGHNASQARRPTQRGGSRWKSVYNAAGREQFTYAMGAFDKRTNECRIIKIGITTALELRLGQVQEEQVGWTETVRYLGWGPGGERRENMIHGRLDDWRYEKSEWFAASPEVLAEVANLERLTDDGRRLTEEMKRSA